MLLSASLLLGSIGLSQSLGEMGRKEKERREKITAAGKPITNDESARYRAGAVTTGTPTAPTTPDKTGVAQGAQAPGAKLAAGTDEPVDFEGRPESFWRASFAEARKRVQDLQNEGNAIVLKINDLQNRFYREDDGFKQQTIQRDIQKSFYEQDLNKENLAKAKDQLQSLEKEARKSGALPGWIK
jgi:hypothetical protein